MWTLSGMLDGDHLVDMSVLEQYQLTITAQPPTPPRQLLVHVLVTEDAQYGDAYTALSVLAVHLDRKAYVGATDLQPLLTLPAPEQQAIRAWLIARRWPAWARASVPVRALLGDATPPVLLAQAARQSMLPLATLTSAAAQDRLPTIRVGDRQLVYLTTIAEAQERGHLHHQRGRPGRRSATRSRS